jgi:hypothetical protein
MLRLIWLNLNAGLLIFFVSNYLPGGIILEHYFWAAVLLDRWR